MEFRILGPLEIRDGERVVEVVRQKDRALLACMLLHPGEFLSVDRLIEDLWGDAAPLTARASLHNIVAQLRRALGPDAVVTRAGGYLLDVDPEAVDLVRFERLVEESTRETGHERAATLRRALAMWRGPPLADVTYEPFALAEVPRLEELETTVEEDLIDVELELGLHADADLLPRIEALVARNPLRERLRAQLMLALYRCDRQTEALAVYQDFRRELVEELGIEPGRDLRAVEQSILRQDDSLGRAPVQRETHVRASVLCAELARDGPHGLAAQAVAEIRAATEYHGGTVGRASGETLLAVFAGHEDDSLRAARAALQMRRAIHALPGPVRIELRTAVTTGPVTLTGGSGLSEADSDGATRLAATASPGEILLDTATVAAAGDAITTEPRGAGAFHLLAADTGPSVRAAGAGPMVGRDGELAQLRAAFAEACAERGCRLVVVAGEAGIGKSRLAAEFTASIGEEGAVLTGRCVSYGEGATYLPLREIVVQVAGDDPRAAIEQRLAGDEYANLVAKEIAELVANSGAASSTGESFWAVRRLLEALAGERPLVLVFDDLHWAEPTFLDLVEYLQQWSRTAPLLIVGLTRPELFDERPAWGSRSIAVPRLADEEVRELVAAIAGAVPAERCAGIVEVAEGNPLFAEQLVARAAEEPDAPYAIPPSLEALISSRIDRLSAGERGVLERAAVVGREFWHGAVLHLANPLDVPSVGRHLLELTRKGLIRPGRPQFPREDGFRFDHVLIRDVAYESLPHGLRADLHQRVADWLDSQAPEQDELVGYHLEHAYMSRVEGGAPDPRALRLAVAAGERLGTAGLRSARRGDIPAARNLLGRAGSLLPTAEAARRDLFSELGLLLWKAGDLEQAERVLREAAAAASASRDRRAELRARVEHANLRLNRDPEGAADDLLALASEAIPVFEQAGDDRALGRIWYATATLHGTLHCRYGAGERAALEALVHYRRSGWPPAPCLQELAAALLYGPASVEDGIRSCREMLEEADLGSAANVSIFLAGLEAMRGDFEEARRLASRSRALYGELGWTTPLATNCAAVAGAVELLAGEPQAAEAILAESCTALAAWGESGHLATQAALLGEAFYRQDRLADAAHWSGIAREHTASDDASAQFSWRALNAKVLARAGEIDEAIGCGRDAARLAGATDALSQHGDVLLDLAEVLHVAGRDGEASTEVEAARGLFERKGNTASEARAVRVLDELSTA